jgi:hypothetical protein
MNDTLADQLLTRTVQSDLPRPTTLAECLDLLNTTLARRLPRHPKAGQSFEEFSAEVLQS